MTATAHTNNNSYAKPNSTSRTVQAGTLYAKLPIKIRPKRLIYSLRDSIPQAPWKKNERRNNVYERYTNRRACHGKGKEKIQSKARTCGLSTTEYVKQRALGYEPRSIPPDALFVCLEKLDELEIKTSSPELDEEIHDVLKQIVAECLLPGKGWCIVAVTGFWPIYKNLKAMLDYADNPDKASSITIICAKRHAKRNAIRRLSASNISKTVLSANA